MTFACTIFDVRTEQYYPLVFNPFGPNAERLDYTTTYAPLLVQEGYNTAAEALASLKGQFKDDRIIKNAFLWAFDVTKPEDFDFTAKHGNYMGNISSMYMLEANQKRMPWVPMEMAYVFASLPKAIGIVANWNDNGYAKMPLIFVLECDSVGFRGKYEYKFLRAPERPFPLQRDAVAWLQTSHEAPPRAYEAQSLPVKDLAALSDLRLMVKDFTGYTPIEIVAKQQLSVVPLTARPQFA